MPCPARSIGWIAPAVVVVALVAPDARAGNYTVTNLGTLGGNYSVGQGINATGQVAGWSHIAGDQYNHAFLYTPGTGMQDLGTLGGTESRGFGINNAGQVVGYAFTANSGMHAFLYSGGTMTDLNDLLPPLSGWILIEAYGINDAGQITGYGLYNGDTRAFLLTPVPEPACLMPLALSTLFARRTRRHGTRA